MRAWSVTVTKSQFEMTVFVFLEKSDINMLKACKDKKKTNHQGLRANPYHSISRVLKFSLQFSSFFCFIVWSKGRMLVNTLPHNKNKLKIKLIKLFPLDQWGRHCFKYYDGAWRRLQLFLSEIIVGCVNDKAVSQNYDTDLRMKINLKRSRDNLNLCHQLCSHNWRQLTNFMFIVGNFSNTEKFFCRVAKKFWRKRKIGSIKISDNSKWEKVKMERKYWNINFDS